MLKEWRDNIYDELKFSYKQDTSLSEYTPLKGTLLASKDSVLPLRNSYLRIDETYYNVI